MFLILLTQTYMYMIGISTSLARPFSQKKKRYHANLDKVEGETLFHEFVAYMRQEIATLNDSKPAEKRIMMVYNGKIITRRTLDYLWSQALHFIMISSRYYYYSFLAYCLV